jgi:hypothetical protein
MEDDQAHLIAPNLPIFEDTLHASPAGSEAEGLVGDNQPPAVILGSDLLGDGAANP